ncbi:MAG: ABC transporter permease [Myxococcota bacterium]
MSAFRALLAKELIDSLRDRRTLAMMILVPLLLYPLLIGLVGVVMAAGRERMAKEELTVAVASDDAYELLSAQPLPPHTSYQRMERVATEEALREKKVWAVVDAPAGALARMEAGEQALVTLVYTKRHDRSIEALERLRRVFKGATSNVLATRLAERNLPVTFAEPLRADEVDLDFEKDLGPLIASRMLPVMLLAMLFMGALYPAIDLTAGEKERGTLETLLVAPVRPSEVLAAKYLTVALIASAATLMNLAAMGLSFGLGLSLAEGVTATVRFGVGQVATLVVCLLPTAFLVSGLALAVASLAKSFKEAQTLLTPLVLAGTVPGTIALMPGIELSALTAVVPLLNVALLVKAAVLGTAQPLHVLICFASVAGCAVLAVRLAAKAFQKAIEGGWPA